MVAPLLTRGLLAAALLTAAPEVLPAEATGAHDGEGAPLRCGTSWLRAQRAAGRLHLPDLPPPPAARAAQTGTIEVGTQLLFPVSGGTLTQATCRRVGEHAYVFVQDRQWDTNGGSILQSHVDDLGELFDASTPADPSRGIFELERDVFGEPPDVDGDPRIYLLILDIPIGTSVVGYFDPQVATHDVPEYRRDVLFIDETFLRRQSYLTRGTVAHELQHLIHWRYDDDEEVWLDEGLSGYAEELAGFPEADPNAVTQFLERPHTSLTDWDFGDATRHYGVTYLFISFLAQRYGVDLLKALVAEPRNGTAAIDASLATGTGDLFEDAWRAWSTQNVVGGYEALLDRRVGMIAEIEPESLPLEGVSGAVSGRYGTTNILLRVSGDLVVDFDGEDEARWDVRAVTWDATGASVAQMPLDAESRGSLQATAADSVAVIVGRTSAQGQNFHLSARQTTPTAVTDEAGTAPAEAVLQAVYPNPFNSSVRIPYVLDRSGSVTVVVHDALGRRVRRLVDDTVAAGAYTAIWDGVDDDGRPVASGTYLVRMRHAGGIAVRSLSLIR
jgi:hypothetical protein